MAEISFVLICTDRYKQKINKFEKNKNDIMAKIKVIKSSSVKSIKAQFKKEFDCSIRIYKGV